MSKADKFIERGTRLSIPKKDKKGTLRTLDAIRALFGPKGQNWMQGEYKQTEKRDGRDIHTFCLVGAAREVDGKYENQAHAALAVAMELHFGDELGDSGDAEDVIVRGNDDYAASWSDIRKVIEKAKRLVEKA